MGNNWGCGPFHKHGGATAPQPPCFLRQSTLYILPRLLYISWPRKKNEDILMKASKRCTELTRSGQFMYTLVTSTVHERARSTRGVEKLV